MPEEKREVVVEDDTTPDEQVVIPAKPEEQIQLSDAEKVAAQVREDFDKLYGSRIEALESRLRQSLRQNDQLRSEITKLSQTPPPEVKTAAATEKDELDALVEQGRWKEAVGKLAAVQAQEIYRQQQVLEQQQIELAQQQTHFEQAKQVAISTYPDLDPETGNEDSEFSKEFNMVLNENSWLLKEPLGPIEAIRLTEQRLTARGVDPATFRTQPEALADNKEVIRRQRASLSGLPPSRTTPKSNTITMTKSEKEFIDYWGISPEEYVRNKAITDERGGIEA